MIRELEIGDDITITGGELDLRSELEVEEPPTELLAWLLVDVFPDLVSELEEKCY